MPTAPVEYDTAHMAGTRVVVGTCRDHETSTHAPGWRGILLAK
jgi:hypothetical protein